jgi:uncharacterized coiled-coil DUF342 family protein
MNMDWWVLVIVPLVVSLLGTGVIQLYAYRRKRAADAATQLSDASAAIVKEYRERLREMSEEAKELVKELEALKANYSQRIEDLERKQIELECQLDTLSLELRERNKQIELRQGYIEHLLRVIQRLIAQLKSEELVPVAEPQSYDEFITPVPKSVVGK